jgi:hypothetical protein
VSADVREWATRLAECVVPDEEELAAEMAEAYVAGGRDRADLFRSSAAVPGGFDVGGVIATFPFILSAIAGTGAMITGLLSLASGAADALDLWDRFSHTQREQTQCTQTEEDIFENMSRVLGEFDAELAGIGIEREVRQRLATQVLTQILADPEGVLIFLNATSRASKR